MNNEPVPRKDARPSSVESGIPNFSLKRILVPTDFPEANAKVLRYAIAFAQP
jgi:hypothetical protein